MRMMGFSMYLFVLLVLGFGLAQNPSGFTSLTCGAPMGTSFLEKATNITYSSDAPYIDTGIGRSIKSSYQSKSEQQTWYLRSFPQSSRSCYTFNLTTGDKYLIRAIFFHGGYDTRPSTKFDLHLGPNKWATVSTAEETKSETFEIIHILATSRLQVCLVKTEDSTPFISAIELRKLTSKAYANESGSLQTFLRADIGSFSKQSLRYGSGVYGADVFDRIWLPYNSENWSQIRTDNSVDNDNGFKVPENVMATASVPTDPDAHMNISLTGLHQTSRFYVCLHFSEIQELGPNDTREFKVMYNGRLIIDPFKPISFYTSSFIGDELGPNANGQCTFSLQKTASSTLPPLLNAMEVYMVNSLSQNETDTKEVDTMINIKLSCGISKVDWQGDPCVPRDYMWSGVNCSYIDSEQPKIISLNLTTHGLTGEIQESISNLSTLQVLDFSNNSLIGPVQEFLAHMTSLKVINLSSNLLYGSIPTSLLDKVQRGLVSLSIEGNPGICSSASCATTNKKKTKTKTMVIASVAASIFLILVIFLVILKRRAKLGRYPNSDDDDNNLQQCNNQSSFSEMANNMFTYEDLAQATDNFSNVNLIGQGGFGYVHKGVLPDGTEVAIKQLKAGSRQGEREFRAEIEIISRVHHRHLVSLLGYCVTGTQRLLVYEFLPNKTLEFHLHEKRRPFDWSKRMKIASGAARGLAYLHEDCNPKTIHRDVKAANVLIDDSYEAKLADFGLAKCCLDNDTHVSTRIMGTCGYLAPEYASSGIFSDKSDVFSFGVMLLELITGRRPVGKSHPFANEENIVDWAKPLMLQALNTGNYHGLVDPRLEKDFDISEIKRMVLCADACVQHSAKHRPKMSQIVRAFDKSISLDDLIQGVALGDTTSYNLDGSSDYTSMEYKEDVKKFKRLVLESQTFGSSDLTSDNGQSSSGSFCIKSET
ncbi:LRR receptor-like serine/threonine-protein kinase IOS1 [Brassica napus]|nr:LRR receptor-like serine/threonine-protein kinase IOS1 [Brassica napus]XP_048630870.1 LRR receptor-like serine/threonine-protein kinase IOS1 [Brassica napus]